MRHTALLVLAAVVEAARQPTVVTALTIAQPWPGFEESIGSPFAILSSVRVGSDARSFRCG